MEKKPKPVFKIFDIPCDEPFRYIENIDEIKNYEKKQKK